MDNLKCPSCGATLAIGEENCHACGCPVSVVAGQNLNGTPIDNKAAIDSMLENASALVEQGKEMGLIEEDNDDLDLPGNDLSPDEALPSSSSRSNEPIIENDPGVMLFDLDDSGNIIEPEPPKPEKTNDKKKKKAKRERVKKEKEARADKDLYNERPEKKQKKKASVGSIALTVVISLVIGIGAGYAGKMFLFPQLSTPKCQFFAEKAVKSLYSVVNHTGDFYIAEAYVKELSTSHQCIVRVLRSEGDSVASRWYRIKKDTENDNNIHVYLPFTDAEYQALMSTGNKEDQAKAAVLAANQAETDRCVKEMKESGGWEKANPALLNNAINPFVIAEKKEKTENKTK